MEVSGQLRVPTAPVPTEMIGWTGPTEFPEYYKAQRPGAVLTVVLCVTATQNLPFSEAPLYGPGQLSRYRDSLRAERSGGRFPVGARFYATVQTDPGVHQDSCTMGTGSFLGVKRPGRDVDHPHPSSAEVKERVESYTSTPPLGLCGLF